MRSYDVKFVSPSTLDLQEKFLLMIFLSMRNLPEIRITVEELSKQGSMSSATVKRKLKSLEFKGFIKRLKRGMKNVTFTQIVEKKLERAIHESRPDIYKTLRKV